MRVGTWRAAFEKCVGTSSVLTGKNREGVLIKMSAELMTFMMGDAMETAAQLVAELRGELEKGRKEIIDLESEFSRLRVDLFPILDEHLRDLRAIRMAVTGEARETLKALGDVRSFLADPAHAAELQRMREVIELCKKLKDIKQDGSLDAVCDSALRLAVNEPRQDPPL